MPVLRVMNDWLSAVTARYLPDEAGFIAGEGGFYGVTPQGDAGQQEISETVRYGSFGGDAC